MWVGPSGSGHFVKMVHNGIEYGMMQALGEGFELLEAKEDFGLDLAAISENWRLWQRDQIVASRPGRDGSGRRSGPVRSEFVR